MIHLFIWPNNISVHKNICFSVWRYVEFYVLQFHKATTTTCHSGRYLCTSYCSTIIRTYSRKLSTTYNNTRCTDYSEYWPCNAAYAQCMCICASLIACRSSLWLTRSIGIWLLYRFVAFNASCIRCNFSSAFIITIFIIK